jgi:hypothetical protein
LVAPAFIAAQGITAKTGLPFEHAFRLARGQPVWAAAVGAGRSLHWPVGIGGDGNVAVAAAI